MTLHGWRHIVAVPILAAAAILPAAVPAHAVDEACKHMMSERVTACAEACRRRALAATNIQDPNNNVLFGCIKICAQNMALQMEVCR